MAMATKRSTAQRSQFGLMRQLFLQHPHSLGMTWATHCAGAIKIGTQLIGAGCAALVHAVVPGCFTETAGKTVARIYEHIQSRKAGAANPESWPDYEI